MSFFNDYEPFIVLGLASGSIYALAAMGLVVTYTTSGVFNFAHGTVAMVTAFAYYSVRVDWGVPTAIAVPAVVLIVGPGIGIILDKLLFRRLQGSPSAAYVVVSIGLLVLLQGTVILAYGPTARPVPPIFPVGVIHLPGVNVGYDQLSIFAIAAVLGVGLALFFKRTQTGLEMRAVVDDPALSELTGADAPRVTALSWMLGTTFASLAGVLLCPTLGVDVTLLTLLVVQAFGAAAIGRLVSLPLTYAGAIGLGVAQQVLTKVAAEHSSSLPWLNGLPSSLPFIVLFIVLLFSKKGSFTELTKTVQQRSRPTSVQVTGFPRSAVAVLVVVGLIIPSITSDSRVTTATTALIMVMVFASLSLLIGLSRQISLSHAVFVVLGATTLAHLQHDGVPFLLALLLSGLVVVPIAGLLAIPAVRLAGLFLALATFGFGVLVQNLLYSSSLMFGTRGAVSIDRPSLFGHTLSGTTDFYYFVLVLVVLGVVVIEVIRSTRLGRILRALADSSVAVETLGVNTTAARAIVFCVSGFFAALAGGLIGAQTSNVSTQSFTFADSLTFVAVLVAAGAANLWGSMLAAVLLIVLPAFVTSTDFINYQTCAFGLLAILLAQARNGLVGLVEPFFASLRKAPTAERSAPATERARARSVRSAERLIPASELLEVVR